MSYMPVEDQQYDQNGGSGYGVQVPPASPLSPSGDNGGNSVMDHIRRSLRSARRLTAGQVIMIIICVSAAVIGMAGQVITLNMWVNTFPASLNVNVPFTVLTLSSCTNALAYSVGFVGWALVKKPKLRFLKTGKAAWLSFWVGFSIAMNGILVVSATAQTPELLQAFLLSTQIIWTFIFVKVLFGETRSYCSPLVGLSFFLSLGGIVLGSVSKFSTSGMDTNTVLWTLIFAAGIVPGALNGVVSAKYMRNFTLLGHERVTSSGFMEINAVPPSGTSKRRQAIEAGLEADYLLLQKKREAAAAAGKPVQTGINAHVPGYKTDANTAKFAMLAFGNIWQAFLMFALLPLSVLPWFGSSPNMTALGNGLAAGYKCTLGLYPGCGGAWLYYLLFNGMFVLSTVGQAFLNYYSPAMTSIVQQLSSPLTAVFLIIIPSLNVDKQSFNVPENIGAVILITIGSLVYTAWEESTRGSEEEAAAQAAAQAVEEERRALEEYESALRTARQNGQPSLYDGQPPSYQQSAGYQNGAGVYGGATSA